MRILKKVFIMKNSNVKLALALGCALAASSAAVAAPNDQLSVADNAPAAVKTAVQKWQSGERLRGRKDKCYGIALAGENDCKAGAGTSCEGSSTIDWQKNAWTYAPKGSCEFIVTPHGPASKKPIES